MKRKPSMKIKRRRARCKQVLVILLNRLETVELVREEVHPPMGDFPEDSLELAVVRWNGLGFPCLWSVSSSSAPSPTQSASKSGADTKSGKLKPHFDETDQEDMKRKRVKTVPWSPTDESQWLVWLVETREMVRGISLQLDELEVILPAFDVLESKQPVLGWFNNVVPALGARPIDLCETARGRAQRCGSWEEWNRGDG